MTTKNMCSSFCQKMDNNCIGIALLLIRLSLAATFIYHGWAKISDMQGTMVFFASLGFGSLLTYMVAYIEFVGGILLAIGVFAKIIGALFAIIMIVAIYTVHFANGFNNMAGGYEFQLLLLASSLAFVIAGAGNISLHKYFHNNCSEDKK